MEAYTDFPLAGGPLIEADCAPIRKVTLVSCNSNGTVTTVFEPTLGEFKIATRYLYSTPGRFGQVASLDPDDVWTELDDNDDDEEAENVEEEYLIKFRIGGENNNLSVNITAWQMFIGLMFLSPIFGYLGSLISHV